MAGKKKVEDEEVEVVECNTDAPRQGPLGEVTPVSEDEVIASDQVGVGPLEPTVLDEEA